VLLSEEMEPVTLVIIVGSVLAALLVIFFLLKLFGWRRLLNCCGCLDGCDCCSKEEYQPGDSLPREAVAQMRPQIFIINKTGSNETGGHDSDGSFSSSDEDESDGRPEMFMLSSTHRKTLPSPVVVV